MQFDERQATCLCHADAVVHLHTHTPNGMGKVVLVPSEVHVFFYCSCANHMMPLAKVFVLTCEHYHYQTISMAFIIIPTVTVSVIVVIVTIIIVTVTVVMIIVKIIFIEVMIIMITIMFVVIITSTFMGYCELFHTLLLNPPACGVVGVGW